MFHMFPTVTLNIEDFAYYGTACVRCVSFRASAKNEEPTFDYIEPM